MILEHHNGQWPTLNGLMAVPNLIGLLLLAPMVFKVTREYSEKMGQPLARS